jgi:hypothetical protein
MKILMRRKQVLRELMLDGVISMVDKVNPRVFESKFATYLAAPSAAARAARLMAK